MTDLVKAIFRNRENRFIAEVEIDGEIVRAHLPNTGRCKELLIDGVTVYLKPSDNPNRKTKYSLHLIENNGALVAMYSQQASKIVIDAILNGKVKELSGYDIVGSEKTIGNSLEELISLKKEGIRSVVFFLIEHPNGNSFRPNWENDPEFSQTLKKAYHEGVEILVYKTENTLEKIELVGNSINFNLEK